MLVYQFATESAIAGWLADRPEPVVINYHSITPPSTSARGTTGSPGARWRPCRSWPCWPHGRRWASPTPPSSPTSCGGPAAPTTTVVPVAGVPGPAGRAEPGGAATGCRTAWHGAGPPVAVGGPAGPQQGPPPHHRRPVRGPADGRPGARLTLVGVAHRAGVRRRAASGTPPPSAWPTPSTFVSGHQRRRAGRPLPDGRRAGHAVRPRGVRGAPGGGHGPRPPDRGLRRRRRGRGPRRRRASCSSRQAAPAGGRGRGRRCWPTPGSGTGSGGPGRARFASLGLGDGAEIAWSRRCWACRRRPATGHAVSRGSAAGEPASAGRPEPLGFGPMDDTRH